MSLLNFNSTPFVNNLLGSTAQLINQPNVVGTDIVIPIPGPEGEVIGDIDIQITEETEPFQTGGKKSKSKTLKKTKTVKKSKTDKKVKKAKTDKKTKTVKKAKTDKKVKTKKQIDLYKKNDLVKVAKKHNISLKKKDGTLKSKLQLFSSLKRKNLL